jgi:hypothetical protein
METDKRETTVLVTGATGRTGSRAARAAGEELTYTPVTARRYGGTPAGFGMPAREVAFLVDLFETLLDGRNAHLSDGVRQVLGRAPGDFTDFAGEAAAAGVWKG